MRLGVENISDRNLRARGSFALIGAIVGHAQLARQALLEPAAALRERRVRV